MISNVLIKSLWRNCQKQNIDKKKTLKNTKYTYWYLWHCGGILKVLPTQLLSTCPKKQSHLQISCFVSQRKSCFSANLKINLGEYRTVIRDLGRCLQVPHLCSKHEHLLVLSYSSLKGSFFGQASQFQQFGCLRIFCILVYIDVNIVEL